MLCLAKLIRICNFLCSGVGGRVSLDLVCVCQWVPVAASLVSVLDMIKL